MSLGNERRPDQLRDKDTIQRECLKAHIEGDEVQIGIYREPGVTGSVVLSLYEPTTSKNIGSPKIELKFDDPRQADRFLCRCMKVVKIFAEGSGTITTEDLGI